MTNSVAGQLPDLRARASRISSRTRSVMPARRSTFEPHPGDLHVAQHAHERQLDLVHEVARARGRRSCSRCQAASAAGATASRGDGILDVARPGRAPRPARGTGSRGAPARAGTRRAACRGRGSAAPSPSDLASWATTGRSPSARDERPPGRSAVAGDARRRRSRRRSARGRRRRTARPRASRAPTTASETSASGQRAARSMSVPARTARRASSSATGAGAASSLAEDLLQPAQRVAQLELAEDLAQPGAVGRARRPRPPRRARPGCRAGSSRAAWTRARRRRGRAGSPCAWRRRCRRCGRARPRGRRLLQQLGRGLVADPGTPGMLSVVSPFSP